MICRCFGRKLNLSAVARRVGEAANLMVGLPDYDAYVAHVQARHEDNVPMGREDFFRDRQAARYGGGAKAGFRCC